MISRTVEILKKRLTLGKDNEMITNSLYNINLNPKNNEKKTAIGDKKNAIGDKKNAIGDKKML